MTLHEALRAPKSDIVRDAAIQRFEYSYETTWKAAQRFLSEREGLEAHSPTAAVRSSHSVGLLEEPTARLGLQMIQDRNLTAHTYNEKLAEDVFSKLPSYAVLLDAWIAAMEGRERGRSS
jgi:nucleotidyltransferase substrate binding protein (TIGR01987 family)